VIRFLIGVFAGVVGTVYFFTHGGADYFVFSSPKVRHLEEQVQLADQQQEKLAKKLEAATAVIEKMTNQFTALEQRFQALNIPSEQPKVEAPPTAEAPSTPAPESGPPPGSESTPESPQTSPIPEEPGSGASSDPPSPL